MTVPDLHEAIASLDDRGRLHLKRFVPNPVPARWAVYVSSDRREITLRAVDV